MTRGRRNRRKGARDRKRRRSPEHRRRAAKEDCQHSADEPTNWRPIERSAGGLNHRFVQIHPFEDGNGHTARPLMSYLFAGRAEPAPVITALEKPRYLDALQETDRGALRTFVQMLETVAVEGMRYATRSIEIMLEGRHSYFHMNGDLSTRTPENGWTRHRRTNGRESVIDIDTAGSNGTAQTDGDGARGADQKADRRRRYGTPSAAGIRRAPARNACGSTNVRRPSVLDRFLRHSRHAWDEGGYGLAHETLDRDEQPVPGRTDATEQLRAARGSA